MMTYTITDIAELVKCHLVASAPDDNAAYSNLLQLVAQLGLQAVGSGLIVTREQRAKLTLILVT